ncbi:MAG: hypothetical protein NVS9B3_08460 [Gemmatimonadaceae bacterium]
MPSLRVLLPIALMTVVPPVRGTNAQNPAPQAPAGDTLDPVRQARALSSQGKHAEALKLLDRVLKKTPERADAHLAAGAALDLVGDYGAARAHIAKAIDLSAANAKIGALKMMAVSYAFEGKGGDAERYERQAFDTQVGAARYSDAAETANELASIYLEGGDAEHALEWYRRGFETALKIPAASDSARTLWEFRWEHAQARIAARQGKGADAQQHVAAARARLARGLLPDQARFLPYLLGYVAFYSGDNATAIAELQRADQRDPFILTLLAQAFERSGDTARAMELYQQVLTINIHNPTNAFARPLARKKAA